MIKQTLLLCLLFTISFAQTSLWKVSNEESLLYIGGTVHLLRPTDYPLPAEFDYAYTSASHIVFETDMDALQTISFQQKFTAAMTYSDGTKLKDHLSDEVYAKVKSRLKSKGIPVQSVEKFKPSMVSIFLTQFELSAHKMASEGVDSYFHNKAKNDKKLISGLETAEAQISFLATLGETDPDGLILNTLDEMDEMNEMINSLIDAWRVGDQNELTDLVVTELQDEFPEVYKAMLVDRNNLWFPQISELLKSKPTEFILVGTAHLVGEDGVLQMLKKSGYRVEQLNLTQIQ